MAAIELIRMISATPLAAYRFLCLSTNRELLPPSSLLPTVLRGGDGIVLASSFKMGCSSISAGRILDDISCHSAGPRRLEAARGPYLSRCSPIVWTVGAYCSA